LILSDGLSLMKRRGRKKTKEPVQIFGENSLQGIGDGKTLGLSTAFMGEASFGDPEAGKKVARVLINRRTGKDDKKNKG